MDAWEAYAVDAAEEQGDQPAEDAISKGLESLADSAATRSTEQGFPPRTFVVKLSWCILP